MDSQLPTGGFIASGGLESALQNGLYSSRDGLLRFTRSSLLSFSKSAVPVSCKSHSITQTIRSTDESSAAHVQQLRDLNWEYDRSIIAIRPQHQTSIGQGAALLTFLIKSAHEQLGLHCDWIRGLKFESMHMPVAFGVLCSVLDVPQEEMVDMLLMCHARTILSAAVRLNQLGPYEYQTVLFSLHKFIAELGNNCKLVFQANQAKKNESVEIFSASPLLDVLQGMHDQLYSRLFNS